MTAEEFEAADFLEKLFARFQPQTQLHAFHRGRFPRRFILRKTIRHYNSVGKLSGASLKT
ncbi:hypothetical protein J6590_027654 [Homalodisca vitripennis]|nr:hypothetical protein J6590_027654 [Homalodisca vitripennis]